MSDWPTSYQHRQIHDSQRSIAAPIAAVILVLLCVFEHASARQWTDNSGKFKVEAELVRVSGGKVYLRSADGKELKPIPVMKLSRADQDFLKAEAAAARKAKSATGGPSSPKSKKSSLAAASTAKAEASAAPANVLQWDLASLTQCRYQTELTLKIGEISTTVISVQLQMTSSNVADDGLATIALSSHRIRGSHESRKVKGSFGTRQPQSIPEGPERDVGSVLYFASWITPGFGMRANGEVMQRGQSQKFTTAVTYPEAVQLSSVLNSQALLRMFVILLGPLPTDPVVEGGDVTWIRDWTSPLSTVEAGGAPVTVPALWTYNGRKQGGDELQCEFPAPGQDASNSKVAGTQTLVFDRQQGRLHSATMEFRQTVKLPTQEAGSEGVDDWPVHVKFDVSFLREGASQR